MTMALGAAVYALPWSGGAGMTFCLENVSRVSRALELK